ncbi:MAG: 1-(5-phosphoribosyl)-5-[(5-phosphoribosylamino)methylideneamino]imidazole-4-carboxamide isomerase [Bacteroidales bacterium]|nr:1-(5-phosphoribosyl)-5-[(5-phosphoribosylamino)methylideneamino]imidazole-4-carboxamide isomerase [Candidatus Cryptobacteroides choladohippi]MCQ2178486.1 1-(5-phosphoribosyl)-5-[(5-phosphoribosylamino)methylideneamino]imidazole-4-carboxamide isomerase [Bacteroidales bacterium]
MIEIIPAIDLIDGRCVRLSQGDYGQKKIYDGDPADIASAYADCGVHRIHLVDLDGAKAGSPQNLKTLERIATKVGCDIEWGGGISSEEALHSVLDAGAGHAIIGSVAALNPALFKEWLRSYGGGKVILGADVRGRKVAVKGWLEDSPVTIDELLEDFGACGLEETICTDISRDGMLQGPNQALYSGLQEQFPALSFTVSGGISSMADIVSLSEAGLRKVIVGKAIYEKRITLKDIELWSLKG